MKKIIRIKVGRDNSRYYLVKEIELSADELGEYISLSLDQNDLEYLGLKIIKGREFQ